MQYFEGLTAEADIKTRYKQLAKEHHPDKGGCLATMKAINAQYEKVITGIYQKAGKSITEIDDLLANDAAMREALNKILNISDLIIEICGSWIWVTGDTRTHKEILKASGYCWSNSKLAWYWRAKEQRSFNRKPMHLDEIRSKHGAIAIPRRQTVKIA